MRRTLRSPVSLDVLDPALVRATEHAGARNGQTARRFRARAAHLVLREHAGMGQTDMPFLRDEVGRALALGWPVPPPSGDVKWGQD